MVRTVRIFLSSPGDVAEERKQVRDLLLGLARGPFVRDRVHIDVVSWDDPHGGAPMDAQVSPQEAVNRGLPKPSECDLTVVLLWGRMGTPLAEKKPDGTAYQSGTEWEFEDALKADKPTYLYRRDEPVLLNPRAPDFDERVAQTRKVDDFFNQFTTEGGAIARSYSTYTTPDDLLSRLRQDVEHFLSALLVAAERADDARPSAGRGAYAGADTRGPKPEVPVAYRAWVKKQHGGVDLLGLQLKKSRPPTLSAIYVPQTTTARTEPEQASGRGRRQPPGLTRIGSYEIIAALGDVDMTVREPEPTNLALTRLAKESLYVSGAPGTGKSTFCRWVAWLVAEGAMPAADVPAPKRLVETLDDGLKGRLPLLLKLREFWEFLPPRVGAALTVADLEEAIGGWVDRRKPDGLDARLVHAHLAHGSALLILDGMDEVPVSIVAPSGKWYPRAQLLSALAEACPTWCAAGNRLLLTSRPYGLTEEQAARTTLRAAPLDPLRRQLQQLLAHRWFAVLSGESATSAATADDLFANIDPQPWLVELAANPLLLTAMCIVFDEGKRLPHDKHDLYERVVGTVLYSRYQDPADIEKVKRQLGVIAYGMHTGVGVDEDRQTPKAEATFHEVERWLRAYQSERDYTDRAEAGAFEAREALLSQSGLLLSAGAARAAFAHLSFQEFFAAQRSFTVDEARLAEVFRLRAATPEWRNTLSFLYGRLLASFPEPTKAIELLESRLVAATHADTGLLLALSDAAQVLTGKGISLRPATLGQLQKLLLESMTGTARILVRADIGSTLGRIGDPRFRPDRCWLPDEDLLGFVPVKAGPFTMGSDPAKDREALEDEQPQHVVSLPDYLVARYPVTVAQFRAFVQAADFAAGAPDCLRGVPNHPVNRVSFPEALVYCAWLTDQLRGAAWTPQGLRDALAAGQVLTLPSEAEWEKAARGDDGRIYPWGDEFSVDRANSIETSLGATSAVGLFPTGASPSGCLDISGNVWELTRSVWGKDHHEAVLIPYLGEPARESLEAPRDVPRVCRGGSFGTTGWNLRAANRRFVDSFFHYTIGFRLVFSRPSRLDL